MLRKSFIFHGQSSSFSRPRDGAGFWFWQLAGLTLLGVGSFLLWQDNRLDQWLAGLAYAPELGRFPLKDSIWLERLGHSWLKNVIYAGVLVTLIVALRPGTLLFRRRQAWLALAGMALAALVVSWLKRNSIHHCPWDIREYGGFAPVLPLFASLPDGIAPGRCFPGGHASVGFGMLSYAFAAHAGGSRHTFWITTGVLAIGVFAGTVQMLRGAHFLSHQLWTLWWCWAVCLAVYGLFRWRSWI
ncbi:MAG: phosphatase PAP2 family protein [Laribacter sp.]|nr:phosphatase PAP2 family protein [Laribacter sp.]MBP9527929.1 phosphatase PAP2 family protein [Laribacter sp.]MBP9608905.1 phosphatase PAP2 family protein [Laribacter sp.]